MNNHDFAKELYTLLREQYINSGYAAPGFQIYAFEELNRGMQQAWYAVARHALVRADDFDKTALSRL